MRANGIIGARRRRIHSAHPCPEGVTKKIWASDTWLTPLAAQIAALRVDEKTAAAIVDALRQPDPPATPIDRRHLERRKRQLALDMASGRIAEGTFLTAMRRLKEQEAAADVEQATRPAVDAARALEYIRNFAAAWAKAKPPTRATMMQAVYQSVTVRGEEFVSVRLTDEAYAHGFAVALPQEVRVPPPPARGRPRKDVVLARSPVLSAWESARLTRHPTCHDGTPRSRYGNRPGDPPATPPGLPAPPGQPGAP